MASLHRFHDPADRDTIMKATNLSQWWGHQKNHALWRHQSSCLCQASHHQQETANSLDEIRTQHHGPSIGLVMWAPSRFQGNIAADNPIINLFYFSCRRGRLIVRLGMEIHWLSQEFRSRTAKASREVIICWIEIIALLPSPLVLNFLLQERPIMH